MKNNSIELLTGVNKVEQESVTENVHFPDSLEIRDYQQLSHKLRSQAVTGSWRLIAGYIRSQWSKLKKLRLRRKTVSELDKLNSFMLKDIGITRGDIDQLRHGVTTVEALNESRFSVAENRFKINKKVDLQVCQCNEKVIQKPMTDNLTLSKCG